MVLEFRCEDVGIACSKATRADSADDLLVQVSEHAERDHGVKLNETLADYALTRVRDTRETHE